MQKEIFSPAQELPPLHHSCGNDAMRPAFNYVSISDGFAAATDATQIVVADLYAFFSNQEISQLDGYAIQKEDWKEMLSFIKKYGPHVEMSVSENAFLTITTQYRRLTLPLKTNDEIKYPNWRNVWPQSFDMDESFEGEIGFNPVYLNKICKSFGLKSYKPVHIKIQHKNRGILVVPEQEVGMAAMLMPVMFNPDETNYKFKPTR